MGVLELAIQRRRGSTRNSICRARSANPMAPLADLGQARRTLHPQHCRCRLDQLQSDATVGDVTAPAQAQVDQILSHLRLAGLLPATSIAPVTGIPQGLTLSSPISIAKLRWQPAASGTCHPAARAIHLLHSCSQGRLGIVIVLTRRSLVVSSGKGPCIPRIPRDNDVCPEKSRLEKVPTLDRDQPPDARVKSRFAINL
jgi:hypothetical protein